MEVLGLIGIIIGLALFLILVYRGWSSFWVAPLCGLIIAIFNQVSLNAAVTSYIGGLTQLVGAMFSVIFMGSILGKVFADTGAASSIATTLTNKFVLGKTGNAQVRVALLVVLVISALCTMGGIDGFILTFTMFPVTLVIAKMVDIPRRFIPGMLVLNCAFMAAPGAPQINNIMAQAAMAQAGNPVSATAGLIPGIVSTIIIAVGGYFTLSYMIIKAKNKGEHFEYGDVPEITTNEDRKLPNFFVSLLPLIAVFVCYSIIELDVFFALLIGIIVNLVFMGIHLPLKDHKGLPISLGKSIINTINAGSSTFPTALLQIITPAGLAAVITSTAAFGMIVGKLTGINIHYIFLTLIVVCIVVGITSSPPAALMVAIPIVVGIAGTQAGFNPNAVARVAAIAATTFETLPVNGMILLTIGLAKTSHKESYRPQLYMSVLWTLIGATVAAIMFALFPSLS